MRVKKFETALKVSNDVEGLCYMEERNELWLLCKARPGIKRSDELEGKRAIYRFDLSTEELDTTPVLLLDVFTIRHGRDDRGTRSRILALAR